MAVKRITKEAEAKLLGSVDRVMTHVLEGESPNEAIIKMATDNDLTPHHVQLVIQAYNNARSNQQRTSSNNLLEKTAHFPLADPAVIFAAIYPNVKEAAAREAAVIVSDEYSRPPRLERDPFSAYTHVPESVLVKLASAQAPAKSDLQPEPAYLMKKAWNLVQEAKREHENKRQLVTAARNRVDDAFGELLGYFKQARHLPLEEVRYNSVALFGKEAGIIFEHLEQEEPGLGCCKCASVPICERVDLRVPPYSYVRTCLEGTEEFKQRRDELRTFTKAAGEAGSELLSHFLPMPVKFQRGSLLDERVMEKSANIGAILGPIGTGVGEALGQTAGKELLGQITPATMESKERKSLLEAFDPVQTQRLRQIRAQAVFHDLMANDEFLQGEDPHKVSKLYNEIVRVSPRAADQPLMMRSLLRRYLAQGTVDPHDLTQLTELEGGLKKLEEPTRLAQLPGDKPEGRS